jgi:hypothetical protein
MCCDNQVYQTAKGSSVIYGALGDSLESTERFLKYFDNYTKIPPTPAMDNIMIKIKAELLFHLALATNERVQAGRSSKSVLIDVFYLTQCDAAERLKKHSGGVDIGEADLDTPSKAHSFPFGTKT